MEAKIAKERGKRIERTVGYDNDSDEDVLRREFGSDTELDELETAGGRADSGRHSQREPGQNIGRIREHWFVQRSSENLGKRNRRLKKPIARRGRMVLSLLADRVYICNKIKLDYPC